MIAALLGAFGALIDLSLHFLQLNPDRAPSPTFTAVLTLIAGLLILASLVTAFNAAALVVGLGVAGMAVHSLVTGDAH